MYYSNEHNLEVYVVFSISFYLPREIPCFMLKLVRLTKTIKTIKTKYKDIKVWDSDVEETIKVLFQYINWSIFFLENI